MTQKYIIDKEDLPMLIKGEALALDNGNAFSVEVNGPLTNGDVIKAVFPNALRSDYIENDMTIIYLQDENESEMVVPEDWWNSPYKECEE